MKIEEILNKLLGDVTPIADQTIDTDRLFNLDNYEDALWFIINSLFDCYDWKDDNRYSAQKIGIGAYQILRELQEELNNRLGDLE